MMLFKESRKKYKYLVYLIFFLNVKLKTNVILINERKRFIPFYFNSRENPKTHFFSLFETQAMTTSQKS